MFFYILSHSPLPQSRYIIVLCYINIQCWPQSENGSIVHGWAQWWTMIIFPFLWNFVFPRVGNGLGLWTLLFIYFVFSFLITNSFHARYQYRKHLWYHLLQNQTHQEFMSSLSPWGIPARALCPPAPSWVGCSQVLPQNYHCRSLHSTFLPCGSPLFRIPCSPSCLTYSLVLVSYIF